ncbi:DNA methyltransferase [Aeromonas caviae]
MSVPRIHRGYPTEKPVELMSILIAQSSNEGELICDPFMGACASGVAARNLNRTFIGNDISEEALSISYNRLSKK